MSDTTPTTNQHTLSGLFTDHPASVDETYFGHMAFALGFAFWLGVAAAAALVHAVLPFACETTASRILTRLHAKIAERH
jgi:hypothetical protein